MILALVALGVAGCNDGDEEQRIEPPVTEQAAPRPAGPPRGLDRSDVQEMQDLLVAVVRPRPRSPKCSVVSRELGRPAVFRCRARDATYGIEWERYGTGRYEISRPPGGRVVARGTLSISE